MTIQNKTIRIDIDAQSIRNLEDVIADLNEITRELGGTIEGVTRELGNLTSPSVTSTSKSAFSSVGIAMKLLKADSEKLSKNLSSLTRNVFPNLSAELAVTSKEGIGKFMGAFGRSMDAVDGKTAAIGLLKGSLKLLAFTSVIGAIGGFIGALRDSSDTTDTVRGRIRRLNDALDESRGAHRDAIDEIDENTEATARLIERLRELQDAEDELSAGARQESIFLVEELNDRMDGLNLVIGESTGLLDENSEAALRGLERYNEMAGSIDKIKESQELWFDLSDGYRELEEEAQRLLGTMDFVREAYEDGTRTTEQYEDSMSGLRAMYEGVRDAQSDLREEMDDLTNDMERHAQRAQDIWTIAAANHELTYQELSATQRAIVDEMVDRWNVYAEAGKQMFEQLGTSTKMWTEVYVEGSGYVRKALLDTEATHDEVLQQMIQNMSENRQATEEWSANLNHIAEEFCAEFAQYLRNLGPEAAGYVYAMVNASCEYLDQLVEEFHLSGESATQNIANSLGEREKIKDDLARILAMWLRFWMLKYSLCAKIGRFV